MSFRFTDSMQVKPPEGVREESIPELWDALPKAYLRLLSAAALPDVHEFEHRAIKRTQLHRDCNTKATFAIQREVEAQSVNPISKIGRV